MKKMLGMLAALGMTASTGVSVVSCTPKENTNNNGTDNNGADEQTMTLEEAIDKLLSMPTNFENWEDELMEIIAEKDNAKFINHWDMYRYNPLKTVISADKENILLNKEEVGEKGLTDKFYDFQGYGFECLAFYGDLETFISDFKKLPELEFLKSNFYENLRNQRELVVKYWDFYNENYSQ